jgi:hypothetical protein
LRLCAFVRLVFVKAEQQMASKYVPTPDEFLGQFPPHIQGLANALRDLVKRTLPSVTEAVYPGWGLIGYRLVDGKRSVYLGFIHPNEERVALGFELLAGDGKQVRSVFVRQPEDINAEALTRLLLTAAEVTWMPKALRVRQ